MANPSNLPAQRMIPGVDVASFQGTPGNWAPSAGQIRWAAVKLTELEPNGVKYVNPDAAADWTYLAQRRLGRIAYLFGHPSVSATDTVDFFTQELRSLGLRANDGVALDLEVTDGLGPASVDSWAAEVMASLQGRLSRVPVLYTYLSFAEVGNTATLGQYPLWIADPSSPRGSPRVPTPWTTWTMHQYETTGAIDRDVANFVSLAGMQRVLGKTGGSGMTNLGGSITGDLSTCRWANGITVVAGLGTDGFVQTKRFHPADGTWGPWRNVSLGKALGAPGLVAWAQGSGRLHYTDDKGAVIELTTKDAGATWQ